MAPTALHDPGSDWSADRRRNPPRRRRDRLESGREQSGAAIARAGYSWWDRCLDGYAVDTFVARGAAADGSLTSALANTGECRSRSPTHVRRKRSARAPLGGRDVSRDLRAPLLDLPGLSTRLSRRLVSGHRILVGLAARLRAWTAALVLLFHAAADLPTDRARLRAGRYRTAGVGHAPEGHLHNATGGRE